MSEEQAPYGVSYIAVKPEKIDFTNESESSRFRIIVANMAKTYADKQSDYGNSFNISVRKYGLISALTRISDKFNRIENLILNGGQKVKDETLKDTLLDLASYAVMTVMAIENNDFENVE